jgi:hypothetical protein
VYAVQLYSRTTVLVEARYQIRTSLLHRVSWQLAESTAS